MAPALQRFWYPGGIRMKLMVGVLALIATVTIPLSACADEMVRYGIINGKLYSIPDSARAGVDFISNPANPNEIVIPKDSKIKLVSKEKNSREKSTTIRVANQ